MSLEHHKSAAIIVKPEDMDVALPESRDEVVFAVKKLRQLKSLLGYSLQEATHTSEGSLERLHTLATVLRSDWEANDKNGKETDALVSARLFNIVTREARRRYERDASIKFLTDGIIESMKKEKSTGHFDETGFAQMLYEGVRMRGHENTWMYKVLPSRRGQPYASFAIFTVSGTEFELPDTCVTQITTRKLRMHSHMHGLSTAFALPNGDPKKQPNRQINTLWRFNSDEEAFPLKAIRTDIYNNGNVCMIPAGWLHTIVDGNDESVMAPSIDEMSRADSGFVRDLTGNADFGVRTSTHIYRPTLETVRRFSDYPRKGIWSEACMLAVNHKTQTIYLGDRHAMELRLASWKQGECCGICIGDNVAAEDDRREVVEYGYIKDLITGPDNNEYLPVWNKSDDIDGLVRI